MTADSKHSPVPPERNPTEATPTDHRKSKSIPLMVLNAIGAVALLALMGHTALNAITRFIGNWTFDTTHDMVTYWYMPIAMIVGIIAAAWSNEHVRVTFILERMPMKAQRDLIRIGLLLTAVISACFVFYGIPWAIHNQEIGLSTPAVGIPYWPVTFVVPIGFGVVAVLYLFRFISTFTPAPPMTNASKADPERTTRDYN